MKFSSIVTTVTREAIIPTIFDTALSGNVGLMRSLGNPKPWRSGFEYDVIVKYQKSTAGGIVGVGGTLNTDRKETRVTMKFEPQRIHKPIVIDDIEITLNKGDERIIELLAAESDSLAQDLKDDLGNFFYTGTGATGSSFDSLFNAADDTTNFATYGTLARSTYTKIKGYYTAINAQMALSHLATGWNNTTFGTEMPTVAYCDRERWGDYEGLLQPVVRAGYQTNGYPKVTRTGSVPSVAALRGDIGFDSLFFRGTPLVADEKVEDDMWLVNERYFSWKGIDLEGYKAINVGGGKVEGPQDNPIPRGFNYTGLLRSIDQPAEVAHIYYVGNWISENPKYLGQLNTFS